MALSDALTKRKKPTRDCLWVALLETMSPEDTEAAAEHMDTGGPIDLLLQAIRDEGYHIGDSAAYRHRRGECSC